MTSKVIFRNATGSTVQIRVVAVIDRSMSLPAGQEDESTFCAPGLEVSFWWRDDGTPCQVCWAPASPCGLNSFSMPDTDVRVDLSDAKWVKQSS